MSKESTYDVDTVWFTVPVPIGGFTSDRIGNRFIRPTRPGDAPPTWNNVKIFLQDAKRRARPFTEQMADFPLLLFLADSLDVNREMPVLIDAIVKKDNEAIQGYETLIKGQCGLL